MLVDNFFRLASRGRGLHPRANPAAAQLRGDPRHPLHGGRTCPSTGSTSTGPTDRPGPFPVVLYVHGGGFRILSKDTHWMMGLAFARRGFLVFNINYRLAPRYPFPAAIDDACAAYAGWPSTRARTAATCRASSLAGESAGANLVTSLAVASCYAAARAVRATRCSTPAWCRKRGDARLRHLAGERPGPLLRGARSCRRWLTRSHPRRSSRTCAAHDGRRAIGAGQSAAAARAGRAPARPLPPFFAAGRHARSAARRHPPAQGGAGRARGSVRGALLPGRGARVSRAGLPQDARQCWSDTYAFLDRHLALDDVAVGGG